MNLPEYPAAFCTAPTAGALIDTRIRELHLYNIPEIISGYASYPDRIEEETA